ncbi:hypothetical protein [Tabrizicola sp.]|uniref:hypothetical protein n=1 Tax=Tabrizicola sp. TaxID=2005166 RepID=UPI00286D2E98|nr:hypothetical protein [Tabrizicola sp.]
MSAVDTLKNLIKLDPASARLVYVGLGLMAAATLVLGWTTSPDDILPLAGWIAGFGLFLTITSHIIKAPKMRATLCWMVIAMIGFAQLYLLSAMFPNSALQRITGRVAPLTCVLGGELDINRCLDDLVPVSDLSTLGPLDGTGHDTQIWLAQAPSAPPGTTVYLQFANPVTRDQSTIIGTAILAEGWGIDPVDLGGEQVSNAPGSNEVRYFNASDEAAARTLAAALEPLAGTPVGVRDLSMLYKLVKEGQLEIWLVDVRPPGIDG